MLQVGVKAPGTANSTTLRPAKTTSVDDLLLAVGRHHGEVDGGQLVASLDGHPEILMLLRWTDLRERHRLFKPLAGLVDR